MQTLARRRWGFLLDPARLCVMFSRAREVMVVVGSLEHVDGTDFAEDCPLPALVRAYRTHAHTIDARRLS